MTPNLITRLVLLESQIEKEQRELCLLVIELAKQVMDLQEETKTLRTALVDSVRGIYNSPAIQQAALLVPIQPWPKNEV